MNIVEARAAFSALVFAAGALMVTAIAVSITLRVVAHMGTELGKSIRGPIFFEACGVLDLWDRPCMLPRNHRCREHGTEWDPSMDVEVLEATLSDMNAATDTHYLHHAGELVTVPVALGRKWVSCGWARDVAGMIATGDRFAVWEGGGRLNGATIERRHRWDDDSPIGRQESRHRPGPDRPRVTRGGDVFQPGAASTSQ